MKFLKEVKCQNVCQKKYPKNDAGSGAKLNFILKGISLEYQHHW